MEARRAREHIVQTCVVGDGDTVETSGSIDLGSAATLWLDRGFGLTERVEGGCVLIEDATVNLHDGESGTFVGVWSDGSLGEVRRAPEPRRVPILLRADPSLPVRTDLTQSNFRAACEQVAEATNSVTLSSGGYGNRLFVSVANITPANAKWWPAYRAVQVDLVVLIVPTKLWAAAGSDVTRIVGRPSSDPTNPFELAYGQD